ncbi:MAG: 3-deoxy-manno-octulosonate cytidylyltransferase [Candidatus Melainabacteria bacterium]|nr:MAG: 3-deoxy-manno-octulosonate cytidylyltransferase [Candidatus Melainabacteria bacterium]
MKKTAIIIPARFASTRLPGKPLLKVLNKPIIQWVWEKAKMAKLADNVIIATDSELIYEVAKTFTDDVEMTSENHKSGSDRIAEVANRHPEFDYIVNLQGDEPLIKPESIDEIIKALQTGADISTLIRVLKDEEDINNPNCVKCVVDNNNFALYFSRSKIPYERNSNQAEFYGHIGIYGYTRDALLKMTSTPQSMLEKAESLEQLRALQSGLKIKTIKVDFVPVGIDTEEDLKKFEKIAMDLK